MAVAMAYTPPGATVEFRKSLSGRAYYTTQVLSAPRPLTRKSLYIYLHEYAPFHLHGNRRKPRHVEEHEAEQWAHRKMREAGIAVPRSMTRRAKEYVAWKIEQAEKRGAKKIDKKAATFDRSKVKPQSVSLNAAEACISIPANRFTNLRQSHGEIDAPQTGANPSTPNQECRRTF